MTELIYIPPHLLPKRGTKLELARRVVSPGLSLAGIAPRVATDGGGLWRLEFDDLQLVTPDQRQAWRAISGLCDGGANKLIVAVYDHTHQPWPEVDGDPLLAYEPIPHSDGSFFSDGSGYYQSVIDAEIVGAVALRATEVTLQFNYGGPPRGGEHFSIDHDTVRHRIYRIVTAVEDDDGNYTCIIRPPWREATADGVVAEFDVPKCVMEPETPDALDIMTDIIGHARPSPKFIEAFV